MKEYQKKRSDVQMMHHKFWEHNNIHFSTAKESFEDKVRGATGCDPTPAQLSQFYKSYLQDNQKRHMEYNLRWWKANVELLKPALRAELGMFDVGSTAMGVVRGLKTVVCVLVGLDPQVRRTAQGVSV
ncbi:hypothetical protein BDR26DRAFT_858685, partial [Obelidium mucronatum]